MSSHKQELPGHAGEGARTNFMKRVIVQIKDKGLCIFKLPNQKTKTYLGIIIGLDEIYRVRVRINEVCGWKLSQTMWIFFVVDYNHNPPPPPPANLFSILQSCTHNLGKMIGTIGTSPPPPPSIDPYRYGFGVRANIVLPATTTPPPHSAH